MENGALDAFYTPITMKKSRPGQLLTVLCREGDKEKTVQLIFRHTTTLGIREKKCSRHCLQRQVETVQTRLGPVRKKVSAGFGIRREKYEYEDLANIARQKGLPLEEVQRQIED